MFMGLKFGLKFTFGAVGEREKPKIQGKRVSVCFVSDR